MIPAFTTAGMLPVGRFQCTAEEFEQAFVGAEATHAQSERRQDLWAQFQGTVAALKSLGCSIPAAFIGGSFTTEKPEPDDIDVTFLIERASVDDDVIGQIDTMASAISSLTNVQALVIYWCAVSDWSPNAVESDLRYIMLRGKWDDWWQRDVAKTDRVTFTRDQAFPKRGYLEVIIDDYL
ncbi:MAG: hypothetical protein Q7V58_09390 [Actinomycetota bacterium]|nr:hypothetical protein [Actinomycetota bacterium]